MKNTVTIFLSLGLNKGHPSYRRKPLALKREHPAIQNMKFRNFYLFLCVIFALMDRIWIPYPDPLTWLNPDPEHCFLSWNKEMSRFTVNASVSTIILQILVKKGCKKWKTSEIFSYVMPNFFFKIRISSEKPKVTPSEHQDIMY